MQRQNRAASRVLTRQCWVVYDQRTHGGADVSRRCRGWLVWHCLCKYAIGVERREWAFTERVYCPHSGLDELILRQVEGTIGEGQHWDFTPSVGYYRGICSITGVQVF